MGQLVTRLDYAPKRVLAYMRDGWELSSRDGRYLLMDPSKSTRVDVNPRTFRVLWQRELIQLDMTWNHPTVDRYLLHKQYRPHP